MLPDAASLWHLRPSVALKNRFAILHGMGGVRYELAILHGMGGLRYELAILHGTGGCDTSR